MKALDNRPDLFQVMSEQCNACLLTPERIVDGSRAAQIIKECKATGRHFICHKASIDGGKNVCCRAFYDKFKDELTVTRMAQALNVVVFVEVGDKNVA